MSLLLTMARRATVGTLLVLVFACNTGHAASDRGKDRGLVSEEFMVRSDDPGIDLYVRNKHPRQLQKVSGDRILLFVHGSTYPAETSFDLPLGGLSMMDFIAQHGYDVYLMDVRGYGKSTRPPEMEQPANQNPPIVRTEIAVKDVGAVVDFILKRRGVSKLNLMGWSAGTAMMGWYTAQHNQRVNKLVLYAPRWLVTTASPMDKRPTLGAYRIVTIPAAKESWLDGVPEEKRVDLIPPGWFDMWATATWATDPVGSKQNPPVLRAPNGTTADIWDHWSAGKPLYDPGMIRVPTFVVSAEWDQGWPSYYEYFSKLANAPYRRYAQIGEGTHYVFMEKNRMQLFREVQAFLDESFKPGE